MNIEFLDQMPGYVSIIDLDLKYIAVNQKLADLMKLDRHSFTGKTAGNDCKHQQNRIEKLIDSPVGTEINWEYYFNNICLAVSSKRNENYIINQAVDITPQKQSLERNQILLQTIPQVTRNGEQRRKNNDLEELVCLLTENPIISQNQTESLIKLEVELRQVSTRLSNLEKLLFLDEASLTGRVKELEIYQKNDLESWQDFENDKQLIKDFSRITNLICQIPGGIKTWFILFLLFQMLCIFWIDLGIRYLDFKQLLPIEFIQKSRD